MANLNKNGKHVLKADTLFTLYLSGLLLEMATSLLCF